MENSDQKREMNTAQRSTLIFAVWVVATIPLLVVFLRGCTLQP